MNEEQLIIKETLLNHLKSVIAGDGRVMINGELSIDHFKDLITTKNDADLIAQLLNDAVLRQRFFTPKKLNDSGVYYHFERHKLWQFIDEMRYLDKSYTAYSNKIGLRHSSKLLSEIDDVVLNFPYKDCTLQGGMTREDSKRKEIFFNNIIAPDEIDRLLEKKAFKDAVRISKDGTSQIDSFTRDDNGTIRDNLLIKGNNLIALHSLKHEFAGRVKLIYIDPPYNTGGTNDTFQYNNNFKHTTWLTFMKNRLEIAKQLLTDDGAMIVAIDENEQATLGLLLKEIFNDYETHCITIVHNPRGIIGANFSYTHEYAYFVIPKGRKTIIDRVIEEENIDWRGLRDHGGESLRTDAKNCFYGIIVDLCNNQIIDFTGVIPENIRPMQNEFDGDFVTIYPIDKEMVERKWRYARQSVEEVKDLLRVTFKNGVYDIQIGKDFGQYRTVWIDKKYDANEYGTKIVNKLVPDNKFSFPKSLWNVYDCLYSVVGKNENAIILDFFGGSGTTAHAVLELNKQDGGNRQFILIEQMDYIENVTCKRVQKVIENDLLGGSFIYLKLADWNGQAKQLINDYPDDISARNADFIEFIKDLSQKYFLNYNVDIQQFIIDELQNPASEFYQRTNDEQKRILVEMLDMNMAYIPFAERADKKYGLRDNDIKISEDFYKNTHSKAPENQELDI